VSKRYQAFSQSLSALGISPESNKPEPSKVFSFERINNIDALAKLRKTFKIALAGVDASGPISLKTHGKNPIDDTKENPETLEFHRGKLSLPSKKLHFIDLVVNDSTAPNGAYRGINAWYASLVHTQSIEINGASIGNLVVSGTTKLDILNSRIGKLQIKGVIGRLTIKHCHIGEVLFPNKVDRPVNDGVFLEGTELASSKGQSAFYNGSQPLRDLLAMLENTHNTAAAHIVRADVLHAEYPMEKGVLKFASWFYQHSCDYGRRPGRAFKWLLMLAAITSAAGFFQITWDESLQMIEMDSWRDFWGVLGHSTGYSLQTALNPFSVFNTKNWFAPTSVLQHSISIVQSITNLGLYFVVALSVKRRFRVT